MPPHVKNVRAQTNHIATLSHSPTSQHNNNVFDDRLLLDADAWFVSSTLKYESTHITQSVRYNNQQAAVAAAAPTYTSTKFIAQ